jgi:ribosomal protein S8
MKFPWCKDKPAPRQTTTTPLRIRIEKTLAFSGYIESMEIATDMSGSEANVVLKFHAEDLVKYLTFVGED